MITQDLTDYARTSIQAGTDDEAVRKELISRGLSADEVDQVMQSAKQKDVSGLQIGRREIYIGLATLLILAAVIFIYFLTKNPSAGEVSGAITR